MGIPFFLSEFNHYFKPELELDELRCGLWYKDWLKPYGTAYSHSFHDRWNNLIQIEYHWCLCCTLLLHRQTTAQNWSQIAVIRLFIENSGTIARQDLFYEFNHQLTKLKGNHSYSTSLEYDSSFTCKNTWANLCCTFYGFESWNIVITKFYHFCSYAQGGGTFYHAINCYSFTWIQINVMFF